MQRAFSTFVGIDLGGARGKTTAVARLSLAGPPSASPGLLVQEVSTRSMGIDPWHDTVLIDYLTHLGSDAVIAVNAPLTVPACLRCTLPVCPGKAQCEDPAVIWLRTTGQDMAAQALDSDLDRIAAIPRARSVDSRPELRRAPRTRPRIEPYLHRASEVTLHYEHGVLPRDQLGQATGPIASRAAHIRRVLAGAGFTLNHNLLEVSPRVTVHALFGERLARGYKRDADPWETRASILERLGDMQFAPNSRLSREQVLRNDHCFDALLSGYSAYLWARDGWTKPDGVFDIDGWIWAPRH